MIIYNDMTNYSYIGKRAIELYSQDFRDNNSMWFKTIEEIQNKYRKRIVEFLENRLSTILPKVVFYCIDTAGQAKNLIKKQGFETYDGRWLLHLTSTGTLNIWEVNDDLLKLTAQKIQEKEIPTDAVFLPVFYSGKSIAISFENIEFFLQKIEANPHKVGEIIHQIWDDLISQEKELKQLKAYETTIHRQLLQLFNKHYNCYNIELIHLGKGYIHPNYPTHVLRPSYSNLFVHEIDANNTQIALQNGLLLSDNVIVFNKSYQVTDINVFLQTLKEKKLPLSEILNKLSITPNDQFS